ncbi:MAG: hypothetical protein WBP61_14230, partial [Nocardioides sp.]
MNASAHRWTRILLAAYCAFLAVVLLSPSSGAQSSAVGSFADVAMSLGVPDAWVSAGRAEFICNVLIVVPVAALGSLIWSRLTWQEWTAYAFVGAGLVELTQGLLLPDRSA